jgi:segregation and condensation protein B
MSHDASNGPAEAPPTESIGSAESTTETVAPSAAEPTTEPTLPAAEPTVAPAAAAPVPEDLPQRVEAVLMATDRALPAVKLSEILNKVGAKAINAAVAQLNAVYEQTNRSFRVEPLAGGWQIVTLAAYHEPVAALRKSRESAKLSPAAMETLAIVAYKQPVTRAQIEAVRGVASGEVLRSLMERRLVKITGRAEELGRPMLYGTTKAFLELFGLSGLKDLPKIEELKPKA